MQDSPLWNLAQSTEAVPDKSFSILEIKQPPEVLEMSTNLSIIEENHQISLQEEEKKTENVIRNETPFLGDIKEKEFMELSIETQVRNEVREQFPLSPYYLKSGYACYSCTQYHLISLV